MPYCFHNNTDSWWRYVSQTNTDVFKSVASLEEEGNDVKDVGGGVGVVLSLPPPGSWYKGRPHYWGGSLTPGFKTALSSLCQRLRLDLNAGPRFRSRDNACSNVSASLEWKRNTRRRDSRATRRRVARRQYALHIKEIRANERYERKQYHLHGVYCI